MSRGNRNRGGSNGIPNDVRSFANASFKKHKKDVGQYYDSKKALRGDYFDTLITYLPSTIDWLLKNSYKQQENIQQLKNQCYEKLGGADGPDFINHINKFVRKFGTEEIENIEYLPIILFEIISGIIKDNAARKIAGETEFAPPDEIFALSTRILKKRIKKATKKGIPEGLAFDLLSVMPMKDTCRYGKYFRVRLVFDILYKYAAEDAIPFETIIKFLVDDADYRYVIEYALQEKKERYKGYNDGQKTLYNTITTWIMNEMEDMTKMEIRSILDSYISTRKRDDAAGKDGVRRYYLTALPENEYPKICSVVDELLKVDNNKKYL